VKVRCLRAHPHPRKRAWANGNFSELNYDVQTGSGAHPASYPMGTRGSFPWGVGGQAAGTSTEVKKTWTYTPTHPYVSTVKGLVGHRDNYALCSPFFVPDTKTRLRCFQGNIVRKSSVLPEQLLPQSLSQLAVITAYGGSLM
jgi:hypothetical protein